MAMQASFGTDGIKKLLDAEQEAQKIVAESRKFKQDRLKQAKAEADKEIAAYREKLEAAFKAKLEQTSVGSERTYQTLKTKTDLNVREVQDNVRTKKQVVVDMLLNYVGTVQFK